ncbi:porin family protein [Chryseobacterium turcicum]|uniref:PorT family protein n=1 Tax=Chryseobacterium turcicum TaxID=2898076 RepID=A0A9Q3V0P9_9FLAO|nr:porin family protein [Chryseobacterium turcicum]MCD1115681.1 PorT family protein [Chryseobacterium turcicum]
MRFSKLIIPLLLVVASTAKSQKFGIKAGANFSSLSKGFDYQDTKILVGANAGVFANIPLFSQFNFKPEVIYNGLGSKVEYAQNQIGSEYTRRLNYISVPLMVEYRFIPKAFLEAGPQLSYMVSAKEKYTLLNGSEATASISKDFINKFDLGIGIGAGYYFTEKIGANIRYVAGITDIYKYNDGDAVRNNNIQLGLMYIIN